MQHIARIFKQVNREHFRSVIRTPTFVINTRKSRTAGTADLTDWTLEISAPYHDHHGWNAELVDTVKHEVIHFYLFERQRPTGHTTEFKAIAARIGCSVWAKAMPRTRPQWVYTLQCPHCRVLTRSRRWCRTWACGNCCAKYNNGRGDKRFALILVSRELFTPPAESRYAPGEQLTLF
jgi:predicted SprT family Zn-dependent metalloprotease